MAYNTQQVWSPTVYGYALFNSTSKIDKTSISFSMWQTTLRITIVPAIENGADEAPKYDFKNSVSIFLTPIKAHLFADIIRGFMKDPDKYANHGIASPQAIISIDKPDTFGHPDCGPVISIRKVNDEGTIELSYSYECNLENFTSIVGFNTKNPRDFEMDTDMFKYADLDCIITQLDEYYKAMTNAQAFSVMHNLYPWFDRIGTKIGVDVTGGQNRGRVSTGFFSNMGTGFNSTASPTVTPTVGSSAINSNLIADEKKYDASQLKSLIADD